MCLVKKIHNKPVQKLFVATACNIGSTGVGNTSVKDCLERWTKDGGVCSMGQQLLG